jgi:RNA polymerase sigma-70 factor (ECF subfamily)
MPLLPAVARGDATAFEQLYDRYSPTLYALLLRILGDADDAQEVLQESFVQIWNRAAMFDDARGSEMAWLVSVTRSRAIDRIRARRTRSTRETEAQREISIRSENVNKARGLDDAILGEQQKAVREALRELPEAQRQALEMAYFEGLSQSEIAGATGEPLGTVKTRMQLGMKKLRERLQQFRR